MKSVLQDWVMELPLRFQGSMIVAARGCDLTPKLPLDSTERRLVGFLRYCFMNPADPREVGYSPGSFFQIVPPSDWKPSEFGHYPQHWVSHLMHAFEVVAYCHPEQHISERAYDIYHKVVQSLHLNTETKQQMYARLTEDRIASGTVVS